MLGGSAWPATEHSLALQASHDMVNQAAQCPIYSLTWGPAAESAGSLIFILFHLTCSVLTLSYLLSYFKLKEKTVPPAK